MFRVAPAAVLVVLLSSPAQAQSAGTPRIEVFGGYSLLPADNQDFPRTTSHGMQGGVQWNLTRGFGLFGEAAVQQGGPARVTQYLWGPRVTLRGASANVFLHGLFGTSIGDAGRGYDGFSDDGPTFGFGGGVDVNVTPRFGVRGQFDLLGSFADIVEGNSRVFLGGVWRF